MATAGYWRDGGRVVGELRSNREYWWILWDTVGTKGIKGYLGVLWGYCRYCEVLGGTEVYWRYWWVLRVKGGTVGNYGVLHVLGYRVVLWILDGTGVYCGVLHGVAGYY